MLFATFSLILILELLRPLHVLLLVPDWIMPTQFSPAFLRAIFIVFSASKIPWRSTTNSTSALNLLHWLLIRQRIVYKLEFSNIRCTFSVVPVLLAVAIIFGNVCKFVIFVSLFVLFY